MNMNEDPKGLGERTRKMKMMELRHMVATYLGLSREVLFWIKILNILFISAFATPTYSQMSHRLTKRLCGQSSICEQMV